jgi:hypothetical protein
MVLPSGGGSDRAWSGRSVAAEETFPDGDGEAASLDSLSPVIGADLKLVSGQLS